MDQLAAIPQAVIDVLKRKGAEDRIGLVGASSNPDKYGNIILKNLTSKGYAVVPVNPGGGSIEGLTAYRSIAEVPEPIAIANFVVPPAVSKKALGEVRSKGIEMVWFQDGSFDDETIELAKQQFSHVVYDACIMVVTNYFV